jgi:predicted Fe-Mo cluster-binding NifX family protein
MKIAVISDGPTLEDKIEERFRRWLYLLIIDSNTMKFESVQNLNIEQDSEIWIKSAKLLAEKGVSILLTGNCGTNTVRIFKDAGVQVITRMNGRVMDVIEHFNTYAISPRLSIKSYSAIFSGKGAV